MILYFSATGNSEYVARQLSDMTGDEALNLFDRLRDNDYSPIHSTKPWIVVTPTYAWRIPPILEHWLEKTGLTGSGDIYFLMTCGGSIANAGGYLQSLCQKKSMHYMGCAEIVMPENYIALFHTPSPEESAAIIDRAEEHIQRAGELINAHKPLERPSPTVIEKLSSGFVNNIFFPLFVHGKKFYSTDQCIHCGKCANLCPTKNIRMENGLPQWGKACIHCMACINRCPKQAIEYGKNSIGQHRYICPK